jgi:chemotaxis protein methyltransferase CheR
MKLTTFDIYAELLKKKSGLSIDTDKSYLLESRLAPIAQKWGHTSVDAMGSALQFSPDPKLVEEIVDAMTTNETFFFRDNTPFDTFKSVVMPYMATARSTQRKMRIWSAAASSGQEPYSLAMILKDAGMPWSSWMLDIVGTDISPSILDTARAGRYTQFEVQRGLPIQMLMNYFTQETDHWQINNDIRSMVRYELFNLLDDPSRFGTFDVIFCRNVLIYFDAETKSQVLAKLERQLAPDGFLFLGGAETVLGLSSTFKTVPGQRGLYAKADSDHIKPA